MTRRTICLKMDDIGLGKFLQYLDEGLMPELAVLIPSALHFKNFIAAPVCGILRATFLSGREPWRNGVGKNPKSSDTIPGPSGKWIGEDIPGRHWMFGKAHVGGGAPAGFPGYMLKGCTLFDGTHSQVDTAGDIFFPGWGYYHWQQYHVEQGVTVVSTPTFNNNFATNVVAQQVMDAIDQGVESIDGNFHAIHLPLDETPPQDEPVGQAYVGGADDEARGKEYLRHMSWRIAQIVQKALAVDDGSDYVVVLIGDNGSLGLGKGSMLKAGINVPCFVWGRGIAPGVSDQLVGAQDCWRTFRQLIGADVSVGGEDSVSFVEALYPGEYDADAPRHAVGTDRYPKLGTLPDANDWIRTRMNKRYQLVVEDHPTTGHSEVMYDSFTDPDQLVDLIALGLTKQQQAVHDRLFLELPTV